MGFSRPEYWSGLPCPPLGDLPNPGIDSRSPALQADSFWSEPWEVMGVHKPLSLPASALGPFVTWLEERKAQHLSSVISFPGVTVI